MPWSCQKARWSGNVKWLVFMDGVESPYRPAFRNDLRDTPCKNTSLLNRWMAWNHLIDSPFKMAYETHHARTPRCLTGGMPVHYFFGGIFTFHPINILGLWPSIP
jgi:hypothetical protein